MPSLKKTPLHSVYEKYGAKTIDFGGWALPVQFSSIQQEHHGVRNEAGIFDVSHMGEFKVTGKDAVDFLQYVTTNDITKLADNQAQYTLMCYPNGGVVDDLLVYKLSNEDFMLVVNASNKDKDFEWLQQHIQGDVKLEDISESTALLAVQGPAAAAILGKVTDAPIDELKSFRFLPSVQIAEVESMVISRTGYTGEDGFEIYLSSDKAVELWERILENGKEEGLIPVGLGARDTLRFEAKLPLYGQELSKDITPIEAGLGFFVKPDKGDFLGQEVLAEQKREGAPRKLVGIEMIDRGIPRSHYPVFAEGEQIGEVTTGTQSPTYKTNVGLALIQTKYTELDQEVEVEIRGKRLKAKVVKTPFYKRK
jgi:aminomethyltransferase